MVPVAIPVTPRMPNIVAPLLSKLNTTNLKDTLTTFTSFHNRFYKSKYGAESGKWLFDYVQMIAKSSHLNVSVTQFHHSWNQHSVIARFEGSVDPEQTVVIGAHQDSINPRDTINGRAPGADGIIY